jgi:DNA helicase IV
LSVNYRTPTEIMAVAADVLHAVDPGAKAPESVRDTGVAPLARRVPDGADLVAAVADAAAASYAAADGGTVGVLVPPALLPAVLAAVAERLPSVAAGEPLESPVSVLTVTAAKGLEFDNVVLVDPAAIVAGGRHGLRDLYVALTRATQQLIVIHSGDLPDVLAALR